MRILSVEPHRPDPGILREAAAVLRSGGLVAFPTETVYGLGARLFDESAVARVFQAKGRPTGHPLIAHVLGEEEARPLALRWHPRASLLARTFWPGPLTLVVDRAARVPSSVSGGGDSLAIRAPRHPLARALLRELGEAVAAPSANRYQSVSPTLAEHVVRSLGEQVDLILDGGPSTEGIESTVLDVRSDPPRVLRRGALDAIELRGVVPNLEIACEAPAAASLRPSPGMDARHYAPEADLILATSREDAIEQARRRGSRGARIGLILRGSPKEEPLGAVLVRVLGDEAARYGQALYATLHALDAAGVESIVVEPVPDDERWAAVLDRLRRGAVRADNR